MALLAARQLLYERARARNPDRRSGDTRNWHPITEVTLNPDHAVDKSSIGIAAYCIMRQLP